MYYWCQPLQAKKFHIMKEGVSLCGSWMMTDKSQPLAPFIVAQDGDCKACVKAYIKLTNKGKINGKEKI